MASKKRKPAPKKNVTEQPTAKRPRISKKPTEEEDVERRVTRNKAKRQQNGENEASSSTSLTKEPPASPLTPEVTITTLPPRGIPTKTSARPKIIDDRIIGAASESTRGIRDIYAIESAAGGRGAELQPQHAADDFEPSRPRLSNLRALYIRR